MLNKTKTFLTTLVLFLFVTISYGQEQDVKKPLIAVFSHIETLFDVKFSYATQTIKPVSISEPDYTDSIQAILTYLETKTPFYYARIDNRYITVSLKEQENTRCGKLINAYTGELLTGANILSEDQSYHTVSNQNGIFYIPKSTSIKKLHISYLGYEPIIIDASSLSQNCEPVLLTRSIDQLESVLLTGFLTKGIKKEYDGSITLNTKDFGLLPGQAENDVLQLIQALPGVESVDETISNLNIRGGSHSENLFLWNGMRMYQNSHFFGLISAFNPEITKTVTLYKNGTPAQFGESTSSVIAMQSRNKRSDSLSGMAGINLINATAALYIPVSKKIGLELSSRKSLTNLFTSSLYHTFTDRLFQNSQALTNDNPIINVNEDFQFIDFSSSLLIDLNSKNSVQLHFLLMENALYISETNIESTKTITNELEQESYAFGGTWTHRWNNTTQTQTTLYKSDYTLHANNNNLFSTQQKFQRNGIIETGVKIHTSYTPSRNLTLESGYQFFETGISNTQDVTVPRFRFHEKRVLRTHALYSAFNYQSTNNKTIINLGVRANYYTKFSVLRVEPRFSFYTKLGYGFALEAQGELKSQTVTQRIDFEDDFLGIEKRRWVLVDNDETPIIKGMQASVGVVYKKNGWFINTEAFLKEGLDITTKEQGFQNQLRQLNTTGDYISRGVEIIVNKKVASFSGWLSYVYMKNDYEFYDLDPVMFPNNLDIRHATTLAGSYTYNNFKIAVGANWRTGRPYTSLVVGNEIINQEGENILHFETPNNKRVPDYFRVNLSGEYTWKFSKKGRLQANVSLLNIFDTKNILNIRYLLTEDTQENYTTQKLTDYSLGFSPNFSLKLSF